MSCRTEPGRWLVCAARGARQSMAIRSGNSLLWQVIPASTASAHAALTVLLLAGVTVFAALLVVGVIEVRRSSTVAGPEPGQAAKFLGAKARLVVVRGLRPNWEYPLYEGRNVLGRADEQPVDIDPQPQEPEDRIWSSRQHAVIT